MKRVVVTRAMIGICHMSVCAAKDATDDEILTVCNIENPSGTTHGWARVIRGQDEWLAGNAPVQCAKDPSRMHFLVSC